MRPIGVDNSAYSTRVTFADRATLLISFPFLECGAAETLVKRIPCPSSTNTAPHTIATDAKARLVFQYRSAWEACHSQRARGALPSRHSRTHPGRRIHADANSSPSNHRCREFRAGVLLRLLRSAASHPQQCGGRARESCC